jgi:hypothetical protein
MYEVFTVGKMPYGSNITNSLAAKQIITGIVPERPTYCPIDIYENVLIKAWCKVKVFYKFMIAVIQLSI